MNPRMQEEEVRPERVITDGREWIVVDGAGGSAHGTAAGWPLRRTHAWLHAARADGEVVTTLLGLEERMRTDAGVCDLAPVLTAEASVERATLEHFTSHPWPTWRFRAGEVVVERSLFMIHGHHAVVIGYRHVLGGAARLRVSPLIVARDPDAIPRESPDLQGLSQAIPGRARIQITASDPTLTFWHQGIFVANRLWRRGISHDLEPRKSEEDALIPGHFDVDLAPGETVVLVASTEEGLFRALASEGRLGTPPPETLSECVAVLAQTERGRRSAVLASAVQGADYTARQAAAAHGDGLLARRSSPLIEADDPWTQRLAWACAQGLARRDGRLTLLDPFPGVVERPTSTLRALPGLISMRAFETVGEILRGLAGYLDDGLIPSSLEGGSRSGYQDPEPSLWMIHAAELLARRSEDPATIRDLYPQLESVLQYYRGGTRAGIRVDGDGLLQVGDEGIKSAALNALWYHALVAMAQMARLVGRKENAAFFLAWARQHGQCFNETFWDEETGTVHEAVAPSGPVRGLRPELLLAVSLTPSVLPAERAAQLVSSVERELFTPLGLRPDPDAVHVEPMWLGTFLAAYLRAHGRSAEAHARTRAWLESLRQRLDECTSGHVPALFDWPARRTRRGSPLPPLEEARPRGVSPLAAAELQRAWIEEVAHAEAPVTNA
ncbi:MAG TPA: glycogen debranching enzyme N-terminal domain-containing protein [Candidatus Eisenbacteria bacterium]|nr:glycogen debranching enzyme N-terminal domain-containing protein [Candidatus Eisenbacteria bacterium]